MILTPETFNKLPLQEKLKSLIPGDLIIERSTKSRPNPTSRFKCYEAPTWATTPDLPENPKEPVIPGGRIISDSNCWNMRGKNFGLKWGDIQDVQRS